LSLNVQAFKAKPGGSALTELAVLVSAKKHHNSDTVGFLTSVPLLTEHQTQASKPGKTTPKWYSLGIQPLVGNDLGAQPLSTFSCREMFEKAFDDPQRGTIVSYLINRAPSPDAP
jgi:hypothetical protein